MTHDQDGTEGWFFPQKASEEYLSSHQLSIKCRDGAVLKCWQSGPSSAASQTLLYFHGNGELVSRAVEISSIPAIPNRIDLFQHLMGLLPGFRVVFMEYRGYGNNEDLGAPNLTKVLNDAEDVYAALKTSDEKMVVMGRSIGTIPAVHLVGKFPSIGTLILDSGMENPLAGVSRKSENPIPLRPEIEARLQNHHSNLKNFQGNLLQLHCNDDSVFPGQQALALFRIASGQDETISVQLGKGEDPKADLYQHERTTLLLFEAGGHNYIWPLNWYLYSQAILKLLTDSALTDLEWWPKKLKPSKKSTCVIH